MTRSTPVIAVVLLVHVGCAMQHERVEDGGIREDSSLLVDAGCGELRCAPGCSVVYRGLCPECQCEPPPPGACETDTDCVIAWDLAQCCPSCPTAFAAADAEADRCLVRAGDPAPTDCRPSGCGTECPAIDCAYPPRAVCEAGACVPAFECAADQVSFQSECAPRCASHADCVIAQEPMQCCGRPCDAMPRALALDRPCWIAPGETGAECPVDPHRCDGLGCAFMECPGSAHAACLDDGTCAFVDGTEPCPPGYQDVAGVCVPLGG